MLLDIAPSKLETIEPVTKDDPNLFVPKTIIPDYRKGSDTDENNLTIWRTSFARNYEMLFAYLTPREAIEFVRKLSNARGSFNKERIRIFRLMTVCGFSEDEVNFKLTSSKHSSISKLYVAGKIYEQKKFSTTSKLTRHHIIPKSRGGDWSESNIVHWHEMFHILFHSLFANLTTEEVSIFITLINQPFKLRSKGVYVTNFSSLQSKLSESDIYASKSDIINLINALNYAQKRNELYNMDSESIGIDLRNFLPRELREVVKNTSIAP